MDMTEQLGVVIKQSRLDKRFSQEQLAEILDITPTHVKHIESGRRKPSVDLLFQMADVLGFSLDDLVDRKKENSVQKKKERIINVLNECDESELDLLADIAVVIANHNHH